jgi:tetratricopeptide (TPR) repeat protein
MRFAAIALFCALGIIACQREARASYNDDVRICNFPRKDPKAAVASCTRLLKDPRKGVSVGVTYSLRAVAKADLGDYDGAISDSNQVLDLLGPSKAAFNTRGSAWVEKGELEKALADFSEALRLDPNWAFVYVNRGRVYFEQRKYDKEIEDLDTAIRLMPGYAIAYNNRGIARLYKGDYDNAIKDFDTASKLDPRYDKSYFNRGRTWLQKGDTSRAIADMNAAIKVGSENPNNDLSLSHVFRGDVYRYKDDFELALNDYDAALRIIPDDIPAFTGKGLTYEKMGRVDLARGEFIKATESKSNFRFAGIGAESLRTAEARLAALDAGLAPPTIPAVPASVANTTSIPTPEVQPAKPVIAKAPAGRRIALVIGNTAYSNVPALANPEKDASAIAASLRNIGFDVVLVTNVTHEQMVKSLRDFANEAEKSDWAMVYYAGHGMEVGGVNYLIPIDAKIAVDRDIQYEAVPLYQVLNSADAAKKIKLIMLDACRDNPFTPRKTAAPEQVAQSTAGAPITTRSTGGRGLAEVKVTGATLVVYAAKDGQVALDGEGGNSPFAVAVVQRIASPGVEINKVFRLVRDDVMEATAGRQEPYTYGSLPGKEDFYFVEK